MQINKTTAEVGEDLRRLKKTVFVLSVGVAILSLTILSLCWVNNKIIHTLELVAGNVSLLTLRLDQFTQIDDNLTQTIGDIVELLQFLPFQF